MESTPQIRVQSNGLPNKCFHSPDTQIVEQNIDFTVNWNSNVSLTSFRVDVENETQLYSDTVCDWSKTHQNNVPSVSGFTVAANAVVPVRMTTMALDGVPVYSGLNEETNSDVFYPSAGDPIQVDSCLGNTDTNGLYRYRYASPCLQPGFSVGGTGTICERCKTDFKDEIIPRMLTPAGDFFTVGLSKDGRVVYGPYDTSRRKYDGCDVDVCNGYLQRDADG